MSFAHIVGHEPAIRLLKGQLAANRLASTMLFVGPAGIGKLVLAIELAKAVQCTTPQSFEACDQCESCRQIETRAFPDVMFVSADAESETGQIKIDQVRTLSNWLALTPYQGKKKIGIIDNADRMTEEAAHACLKLLEEPSENSFLILIASALHRLSATLVSRCHVVRCIPQGVERTAAFLMKKEKMEKETASLLATIAGGRLGIAYEFHREERLSVKNNSLDQLINAWRQRILEIPLGSAPRPEIEEALEWLAIWWRDRLILVLDAQQKWLIHQDRIADLKRDNSRQLSTRNNSSAMIEELLTRIERTYMAKHAIQHNASPRIALAALLSQ